MHQSTILNETVCADDAIRLAAGANRLTVDAIRLADDSIRLADDTNRLAAHVNRLADYADVDRLAEYFRNSRSSFGMLSCVLLNMVLV